MKRKTKRKLSILLLLIMFGSLLLPFLKASVIKRQNNTVNNSKALELYAGISKEIYKYSNMLNEKDISVVQTMFNEAPPDLHTGYTTTNVNIREYPSADADIIQVKPFDSCIKYYSYNDDWYEIVDGKNTSAFISSKYVSDSRCNYKIYNVPENRRFKSYMPYTAITSRTSPQYKLQNSFAYTGNYGIRQINGRYCVAIGTAFDVKVGTYFDLILKNGTVIPCIVGDIKSASHTRADNIITANNGCMSEFVVDSHKLDPNAKRDGDISSCTREWDSEIDSIKIYEKNIFD